MDDNDTFTITLNDYNDWDTGNFTLPNYSLDTTGGINTIDASTITFNDWTPTYNGKYIDFDVLEKYPTAKTLYNQFISVYNMCEEEEKLNGE